jgi:hypothetical protein
MRNDAVPDRRVPASEKRADTAGSGRVVHATYRFEGAAPASALNRRLRVSRVSKVALDSESKVVEQAKVDAAAPAAAVKESASSWSGPLDELQ